MIVCWVLLAVHAVEAHWSTLFARVLTGQEKHLAGFPMHSGSSCRREQQVSQKGVGGYRTATTLDRPMNRFGFPIKCIDAALSLTIAIALPSST